MLYSSLIVIFDRHRCQSNHKCDQFSKCLVCIWSKAQSTTIWSCAEWDVILYSCALPDETRIFFFLQLFEYFKQICFVVREYYCNCYYFCFFCPTKYFWCPYMPNYYLNCSSAYSLNWMVDVKVIVVDVKCIKSIVL